MDSPTVEATIRLLIFSGRPDPEWELDATQAAPLFERVRRTVGDSQIHPPPPGGLGYRGFLVRTSGRETGIPADFSVYRSVLTEAPGLREVHWQDAGGVEAWLLDWARTRFRTDPRRGPGRELISSRLIAFGQTSNPFPPAHTTMPH